MLEIENYINWRNVNYISLVINKLKGTWVKNEKYYCRTGDNFYIDSETSKIRYHYDQDKQVLYEAKPSIIIRFGNDMVEFEYDTEEEARSAYNNFQETMKNWNTLW